VRLVLEFRRIKKPDVIDPHDAARVVLERCQAKKGGVAMSDARMKGPRPTDKMRRLVDEVVKERPDEKLIKKLMGELGLKHSEDPIDQMNTLLRALHGDSTGEASL
jgi:hypothetical protein